jgi:hypothetical protein
MKVVVGLLDIKTGPQQALYPSKFLIRSVFRILSILAFGHFNLFLKFLLAFGFRKNSNTEVHHGI